MFMRFIAILLSLTAALARPPPETCDPSEVQECLASFETNFLACDPSDLHCQCNAIITSGANCYAACPQDAMTTFIQTYNDGKCATFDPFLSPRTNGDAEDDEEAQLFNDLMAIVAVSPVDAPGTPVDNSKLDKRWAKAKAAPKTNVTLSTISSTLSTAISSGTVSTSIPAKKLKALKMSTKATAKLVNTTSTPVPTSTLTPQMHAVTVTPSEPTTTISLSPEEHHSSIVKSRYKANLRSIRSERARLSSEDAERIARMNVAATATATPSQKYVNKKMATAKSSSAAATASSSTATASFTHPSSGSAIIKPSLALALIACFIISL